MRRIVDFAIDRARLTLALLAFLLVSGAIAYNNIPKEANPDIPVPIIYVQLSQQGISPEDAEELLVRPMETELNAIADVKEMRAAAFEGGGYVLLEFEAGFDSEVALQDVRAKVDDARAELPADADEPRVEEVNFSLFPVIVVALAGDISERALGAIARHAQDVIEQVPGVLTAELRGVREEAVEIIAEPMLLSSYGVSLDDLARAAAQGNSLVAAGALEGEQGRFAVSVPGRIEDPADVLDIPVKASSAAVVTLGSVAAILPTFKDATSITRVNGRPAVTIDVTKRAGANLIETVAGVKAAVGEMQSAWPSAVSVEFLQDQSKFINDMLTDLQNSVILSVILVAVIILFFLGWRASIFIGIAIPFSFLVGILGLAMAGLTVNIVVLFSLILAVGMLVDNAIIVSEFAERRMNEGMQPREAYAFAASRMSGPTLAATLTSVAAFSPLLFWPGIVGEFMKYLPITLIATLSASLVAALVFTPTLGGLIGVAHDVQHDTALPRGSLYIKTVLIAIRNPGITLLIAFGLMVAVPVVYGKFGKGVEFFPEVEPDVGIALVHARGNLSIAEKDRLVRSVEEHVLQMPELSTVYARSGEMGQGQQELTEDVIGQIQFEFVDWRKRRPASQIMDEIRDRTAVIPGIHVEVTAPNAGPPTGKPIQVQLSSDVPVALRQAALTVAGELSKYPEVLDLDNGLPMPGIDWRIDVDKAEAAKYGIGVTSVGSIIKLATNGLILTEYRPDTSEDPVDLIVRFPEDRRTLNQIDDLRIQAPVGAVPIGNFIERRPSRRTGVINRVDGKRVVTITANVAEGVQSAVVQEAVKQQLEGADFQGLVTWKLKGEDEEREAASAFLANAFGAAVFLIFAVLLAQFNKFTSVFLVLFSIILSTIGVFLGMMIMGQPFGVVMTGLGIIALAGIVANNNIVLIDTYDRLRLEGVPVEEAILRTCRERARPVLLTAGASVLGVLPIAFGVNVNFVERDLIIGAPSTQWWIQLSTAIVFGLSFATILTLIVTPAQLAFVAKIGELFDRLRRWRNSGRTSPKPA